MASSKIQGLTIAIGGDTTEFVQSLTKAESELKTLQTEMGRVNSGLKLDSSSTELLTQKSTILTKEIEALSSKLITLKSNQDQVNSGFDSTGQKIPEEEIRKYNTEVAYTEAYLQKLKNQLDTTNEKLAENGEGVQNVSDKMNEGGNSADQYREALSTIFSEFNISLAAVTAGLVKIGQQAIEIGIEFESAFAGVKKTVDATTAELDTMREGLLQLSTEIPVAASELAGIGEAAGQLGIANEYLLEFTEVMANLGVATNMTSEQAATDLAKLANITGMMQSEFSNLGSAIVELGNNFATTESDITAMATNMASAGTQAGLSEADILGFAAAVSSLGIEAQAGGTATSKIFAMLQTAVETNSEALTDYAEVAGMTGTQFKKAFEQDAAGAITSFITGLGNVERSGKSATVILDELGITETRLTNALKSLAGSGDLLTGAIEASNTAWTENSALTNEAEAAYSTMANQIQLVENELALAGETIYQNLREPIEAVVGIVGDLISAFNDLPDGLKSTIVQAGVLVTAILGAKTAVSALNTVKSALALISGTAATATAAETVATTANTAAITANTGATALGTLAQNAFAAASAAVSAALAANPIGAVVAAAFIAVKAYDALTVSFDEQVDKVKDLTQEYKTLQSEANSIEAELTSVKDRIQEINSQESLSIADEAELETLQKTNMELETQLLLKQRLAEKAAEEATSEAWVALGEIIKDTSIYIDEYGERAGRIFYETLPEAILTHIADIETLKAREAELVTEMYNLATSGEATDEELQELSAALELIRGNIDTLDGKLLDNISTYTDLTGAMSETTRESEEYQNALGATDEAIDSYLHSTADAVDETEDLGDSFDDVADAAEDAAVSITDLKKQLSEGTIKAEDYTDALIEMLGKMKNVDSKAADNADSYSDIAKAIDDATGYTLTFLDTEDELQSKIDLVSDAFDENGKAVDLSTDQIRDLEAAGLGLAIQYDDITGAATLNKEETYNLIDAMISAAIAEQELIQQDLVSKLEQERIAYNNLEDDIYGTVEAKFAEIAVTEGLIEDTQTVIARYEALRSSLGKVGSQYKSTGSSAKSSGSSASSAADKVSDAIQTEIDQLEKLRKNGDITYREMIASLENMLESYSLNATEREKIEEKLASAYSALLSDEISQLDKLRQSGKITYKEMALALEDMLDTYTMTATERINLEGKVAEAQLSYIGEVQDATVEYANLVSQAIQNRYQDEYNTRATAINDNLTAIKNAAYDEYTITYNGSTDKISLYSTEYREKIRLIDEATGAAIDGLNDEILKELELLGIKTDGYADEIAAQQKIIDDNAAARAQEKIDDEDKQYRKQKAALEEQILNAETAESRKKLQDQLATLEENYDKTLRERKRKAEDDEAAENIKRINEVAQAEIDAGLKVIDELGKAQDGLISDLEASQNADLDAAGTTLEEQLANADKEAAALITTSEESQKAALAVLEEYYPEWREAGKTMVDYISEGLQENQGEFIDELDTTGVLAMEGFIAGLESQRDEIVFQARSLAQAFMDEFNAVLDIHSPSREASWSGQMFGQGFTTGIEDSVDTVMRAAQNLGLAAISGLNGTSAATPALGLAGAGGVVNNDYSVHFSVDTLNQSGRADVQAVTEELSAWQRIQMSGKGAR